MESKVLTLKFEGSELRDNFSGCKSLADAIRKLEGIYWEKGYVLCEIWINGMFFSEQDEARFADTNLEDIKTLEIATRRPGDLQQETIESVREWIPKVNSAALQAAEDLRQGQVLEGLHRMKEIFEGCQWLSDVFHLLKFAFVSGQESSTRRAEIWSQCEVKFTEVIKELLQAVESKDYLLVADLLEYEVSIALDNWLELFGSRDRISSEVIKQRLDV